jgi:SAM-dependent methyltransferase
VVGVDSCPGMVQKARQNFPFENVYELDADVESLPLRKDTFDHAITFAAFAHFTYPDKVIREVARVLKKGGRFFIIHLLGSEELQKHHSEIGGPVAGDHLPPDKELIELFKEAGFMDIKITDHPGLYLASAAKG